MGTDFKMFSSDYTHTRTHTCICTQVTISLDPLQRGSVEFTNTLPPQVFGTHSFACRNGSDNLPKQTPLLAQAREPGLTEQMVCPGNWTPAVPRDTGTRMAGEASFPWQNPQ